MKTENNRFYLCDEGKVFRRKSDGFIVGDGIDLGIEDAIENYEEIDEPKLETEETTNIEPEDSQTESEPQAEEQKPEEIIVAAAAPKKKRTRKKTTTQVHK